MHTIEISTFFSRGWGSFHVNDDDYRVFVIISCCVRWLTIIAGDFSGGLISSSDKTVKSKCRSLPFAEDFTKLKIYAPWVEHKIAFTLKSCSVWMGRQRDFVIAHKMHTRRNEGIITLNHMMVQNTAAIVLLFSSAFFLSRKCILMHPSVNFLQITSWQMVMTRGFCET